MTDILQNPFDPRDDTQGIGNLPLSSAAPSASLNDPSPLMGFPARVISSQEAEDAKQAEETRRQMDIADKASSGFWPTALATAAAVLKADFKPLMQLQQQKQQTAFSKAITPDMLKIERLTQAGKFEDAEMLMSRVAASVGERAPQLAQFLQQRSKRIADKQQAVSDLKSDVFVMEGSGLANKDHPNYNFYTAMKKLAAQGTPYSAERAKEMIAKGTNITTQVIGERQTSTGGLTNVLQTRPVPQVYTVQMLEADPLAKVVAGQYNLGIPDLADILNKTRDVDTRNGIIKVGSPEAEDIHNAYIAKQPTSAAIAIAKQRPDLNPDLMAQIEQLPGMTPEKLAAKQWTPVELKASQEMQTLLGVDRAAGIEQGKILAELKTNPKAFADAGQVVFNAAPDAATFGTPVPLQTVAQVIANQGRLSTTDKETHQRVIVPGMQAVNTLSRIPELFQLLGNPKQWKDRTLGGIARVMQDRLGIAVDPDMEMTKAAQLFIDRAIEEAAQTQGVDVRDTGKLKTYVTGPYANAVNAKETAAYIQRQILDRIYRVTNVRIPTPLMDQQAPREVSPGVYSAPGSPTGTPQYPPGYRPGGFVPESPYTTYTPGPLREPLPPYTPPKPLPQQAPPRQAAPPGSEGPPKVPKKWKGVPASLK